MRMLNTFQNYLERLTDAALIQDLVYEIAAQPPPAVVWRLLITCLSASVVTNFR